MKKINNKVLILVLVVLVGVFIASRLFRSPGLESTIRKDLVSLDSATITEIRISPANQQDQLIKLMKSGKTWTVEQKSKKYNVDINALKDILQTLCSIKPERMVSRKKEKWQTFQVGETGTYVSMYEDGDLKTSMVVGKSGFNQSNNSLNGGNGYTYVRLSDEDEVYSVPGFLSSSVNRSLTDLRDKSFLKVPKDLIQGVSFKYPSDSGYVLQKRDTLWQIQGASADRSKVESYLSQFANKRLTKFADEFNASIQADAVIDIVGSGGTLCTIEGWKTGTTWTLRSSLQPGVFFSSEGSTIEKDLLVGKSYFETGLP
jgi:hypothetical protein